MKLLRLGAAVLTSALTVGAIIAPSASAATVEIIGDNMCKFTLTNQDFNDVVAAAADPGQGSLKRLNELFPEIEGGLDLVVSEVASQLVATNKFESEKLTAPAQTKFQKYLELGVAAGFNQNELMSMLVGASMSPLLVASLNAQKSIYIGTFHLTKTNAQQWIDIVDGFPGNYGFNFDAKTYNGQPIKDSVLTVLEPSIAVHENLVDVYSVPFESCITGVPSNGGGNGNGGDNGSGGNGNGGNGNGGGGFSSSFGSS